MVKDRKIIILTAILFSINCIGQSEKKAFSNLIIGTSGSVLYADINTSGSTVPYNYFEYHWTLSLSTDISRFFRIGVDRIGIYGNLEIDQPLALYGGFIQFDFLPALKHRGFIELNYHRGNFCNCEDPVPYSRPGLNFIGGAIGFDWAFSTYLHLNTGMKIAYADANLENKAGFGEYFIGLDLHLFPEKPKIPESNSKNPKFL